MSTRVLKVSGQNFAAFQRKPGNTAFQGLLLLSCRHFLPNTGGCGNPGSWRIVTMCGILPVEASEIRFFLLLRMCPVPFLTRNLVVENLSPFIGGRIDRCVQELVGGSRSHVTGLFDYDCVTLNGDVETNPGQSLKAGDRVLVRFEENRRYSPRRRPQRQQHRVGR